MKKIKRLLLLSALSFTAATSIAMLASCFGGGENSTSPDTSVSDSTGGSTSTSSNTGTSTGNSTSSKPNPVTKEYSVSITSIAGKPLDFISIQLLENGKVAATSRTNENGVAKFNVKEGNYSIAFGSLPAGYIAEESYPFNGKDSLEIVLKTHLIDEAFTPASGSHYYEVGDIFYDVTVRDSEGNTVKISEILEKKDMVLLNFFYDGCSPCEMEFPLMQSAYEQYQDTVEIVSLSIHLDDNVDVYQAQRGLTFTMATDRTGIYSHFQSSGVPTNVIIDRNGVICMIEVGGITSKKMFPLMFSNFVGKDYDHSKLIYDESDLAPRILPTVEQPKTADLEAAINNKDKGFTSSWFGYADEDEYSWPFVVGEKDGKPCAYPSNKGVCNSFATLRTKVHLTDEQGISFEYFVSSEYDGSYSDMFYVTVEDSRGNQTLILNAAGIMDGWQTKSYIAPDNGDYIFTFIYLKDVAVDEGEDAVYLRNFKMITPDEIEGEDYVKRFAATGENYATYANVVFNSKDGYYHVGDENGPLLLADLMGYTRWNNSNSLFNLAWGNNGDGGLLGLSYYNRISSYCADQTNTTINLVSVNKELADLLKEAAKTLTLDENKWLQMCCYYEPYGGAEQLPDPCAGLRTHNAFIVQQYEADGETLHHNKVTIDRPTTPKGMLYAFTPEKSGVYRLRTYARRVEDKDLQRLYETLVWLTMNDDYNIEESKYIDDSGVDTEIIYYMEANRTYYFRCAYFSEDAFDTYTFTIEYYGETYQMLVTATPDGMATFDLYDIDLVTGNNKYTTVTTGIDVVLGEDGYYHAAKYRYEYVRAQRLNADGSPVLDAQGNPVYWNRNVISDGAVNDYVFDREGYVLTYKRDENGKPIRTLLYTGSIIYADVTNPTINFNKTLEQIVNEGGFDFTKDEFNKPVYQYKKNPDGSYMTDQFGDRIIDTDENGNPITLGENLTASARRLIVRARYDATTAPSPELIGCVPITQDVADLLQKLEDKYWLTSGIDHAWINFCYYVKEYGGAYDI